jgi:uncharacterized protein YprB with RNaseH-like and TPR domain
MTTNLGERLRQVVAGGVPALTSVAPSGGNLGTLRGPGNPEIRLDGWRIADILGGQWHESREGAVLIVDRHLTPDRRHGRTRIGEIVETLEAGGEALQVLARAWPGRDPRPYTTDLCFFDLETTGLAGGAGTQAFLVGCARVEDGGLQIRQFLLPGFEHERALLAMLTQWNEERCTLVTFNGRTFDLPLIETRYLFHRLTFPLGEVPHLDMLHPARRLWKQRPTIAGPPLDDESCKLSVLERHLAGYHRVGDVAGFEVPSRYFRFIRHGDVHPLEAVLEHNRIDLVSLALVTAQAITLITRGPHATTHPREALGLGRVYERSGMAENAEASYAHAATFAGRIGREPDVRADALRRLALCRRRAGRMADAAAAWHELIAVPGCPAIMRREAREALAVHHEHRSRDLDCARSLVLDVLSDGLSPRTRAAAEYRLQRLERKLGSRAPMLLFD